MKIELSADDTFTIKCALSVWISRCDAEARQMRARVAEGVGDTVKCIANAEASEGFAQRARELASRGVL